MYKNTETNSYILRLLDNLLIPTDCNNADYRDYLAYLVSGNVPAIYAAASSLAPTPEPAASSKIPVVYDMFRNTNDPLVGNKTSTWAVGGSCFTAQSIIFHANALAGMNIESATWRLTWLPNIPTASQTAVRLCSADSGPSNITEITSFFGSANTTNPRNDAVDVTAALKALVDSHKVTPAMFQLFTQTIGDGTYGPLIYSSALEVIYNA